jgi:hypothetical protein
MATADPEKPLARAFYSFAERKQKRLTTSERNTEALSERVRSLEERLLTVEKRLNMPPAA